jgi:hypothetical protein
MPHPQEGCERPELEVNHRRRMSGSVRSRSRSISSTLLEKPWADCESFLVRYRLSKAFHVLVAPGDQILVEAPAYAGVLNIFGVLECDLHEVKVDQEGVDPEDFRKPSSLRLPASSFSLSPSN